MPTTSLWIGDGSSTDTGSRVGRGSSSTDSGELLISDQNGFQEFVLFGIGEEIAREQFARLFGGRLVPVQNLQNIMEGSLKQEQGG